MICGFTSLPEFSGLVSTCELKAMVGAPGTFPGMVAKTRPCSSWRASARPSASNSSRSSLPSTNCPGELGYVVEFSSALVSTRT
jgi:hypothetical protein